MLASSSCWLIPNVSKLGQDSVRWEKDRQLSYTTLSCLEPSHWKGLSSSHHGFLSSERRASGAARGWPPSGPPSGWWSSGASCTSPTLPSSSWPPGTPTGPGRWVESASWARNYKIFSTILFFYFVTVTVVDSTVTV